MPWPFCNQCGNILDPPTGEHITCELCGFACRFDDLKTSEIITQSAPRARPAWLGDEGDDENATNESENNQSAAKKHAVIEEPCPKCGHHLLYFYTMQLRSVDEGSTVFYECVKCAHKYSVNN
jgi:DNA-directed RNA polymerase I subunit RPA12